MKTIYIDADCKCHATPGDGLRAIETDFFDGKCDVYIEGFRYVPMGETWTRSDGVEFRGEMICAWQDYNILAAYQKRYEANIAELEDMRNALNELGVTVNG